MPPAAPRRFTPARTLLYAGLLWAAGLLALEGLARLVVPPAELDVHREHREMIDVLGLPALNATMEYDPRRFWRLRDGLRGLHVAGQVREQPIDFRVSTFEGFRAPEPPQAAARRVLALGDSCTFGLGVDDAQTWPARLEARLRERGLDAAVVNAGVPGYTAFQGLRTLEAVGPRVAPELVVVSFGFNDRDLWATRSDMEIAFALRVERAASPLRRSRLVQALERGIAALRGGDDDGKGEAEGDATLRRDRSGDDAADGARAGPPRRPRLSPAEFEATLGEIAAEVRRLGARPVFLIWPYRFQVREGVTAPVRYQGLLARVAAREGIPLVNPTPAFVPGGDRNFVDHVHATAAGNRLVADALEPVVARALAADPSTP